MLPILKDIAEFGALPGGALILGWSGKALLEYLKKGKNGNTPITISSLETVCKAKHEPITESFVEIKAALKDMRDRQESYHVELIDRIDGRRKSK
jgi:hypothetical protein